MDKEDQLSAELAVWYEQLTKIGRRAYRGEPVELVDSVPSEQVTEMACDAILQAIDAVLTAATNAAGSSRKHTVKSLQEALAGYHIAAALVLGLSLHAADGDEILDEVFSEMRAARDSLNILYNRHWDRAKFLEEVRLAESIAVPKGWRPKLEVLSFSYDDAAHAVRAA